MCRISDATQDLFHSLGVFLSLVLSTALLADKCANGSWWKMQLFFSTWRETAKRISNGFNISSVVLVCFLFVCFLGLFVLANIEKDVNGRVAARFRQGKPPYLAASLKTEVRLFVLVFFRLEFYTPTRPTPKKKKNLFMLWWTEVLCVFFFKNFFFPN